MFFSFVLWRCATDFRVLPFKSRFQNKSTQPWSTDSNISNINEASVGGVCRNQVTKPWDNPDSLSIWLAVHSTSYFGRYVIMWSTWPITCFSCAPLTVTTGSDIIFAGIFQSLSQLQLVLLKSHLWPSVQRFVGHGLFWCACCLYFHFYFSLVQNLHQSM